MIAHLGQGIAELVDRIVADRNRTMAAGVDRLQPVILSRLLADLDGLHQKLTVTIRASPAALVQRERRGDEIGPVLRQPLRTIEGKRRLLPARQRQFDRAARTVAAL